MELFVVEPFASAHHWCAEVVEVVESAPKVESPGLCPRKMRRIDWAD
jgi:hypothetical protein